MASQGLVGNRTKYVFEDWTDGTVIGTSATTAGIKWLNSSDGGDTAFVAVDNATYGPVVSGVASATDAHMLELSHRSLGWTYLGGRMWMETRMQFSVGAVASAMCSIGFSDDQLEDSNALPVTLSGTTFTSNSSTGIYVVFDSHATNADFHAFWVNGDSDTSTPIAQLRFKGLGPTLANWFGVRIVLDDRGSGNSPIAELTVVNEATGQMQQKRFTTNLTRTTLLTPHMAIQNNGGVAHTALIDYIEVAQSRV